MSRGTSEKAAAGIFAAPLMTTVFCKRLDCAVGSDRREIWTSGKGREGGPSPRNCFELGYTGGTRHNFLAQTGEQNFHFGVAS
jgi:hypothetical protein